MIIGPLPECVAIPPDLAAAISALIRRGISDIEARDGIRLRKMPNGPAILAALAELDAVAHRAAKVKDKDTPDPPDPMMPLCPH